MTPNERERLQLQILVIALRAGAHRIGSMSALWDVIFDIEAFLDDKPTCLTKTAPEWIEYAKNCISKNT